MSRRPASRRARARGIALADFLAGTLILAGAVSAWVTITRAQIESAAAVDRRATARNAAVLALDEVRLAGVASLGSASGDADANGFRLLKTFPVAHLPASITGRPGGRLEVRPLRVEGETSSDRGLVEVRARVLWRSERNDDDEVEVSTALGSVSR